MIHDFAAKLAYSRGIRESTDLATIKTILDGCVTVAKTDVTQDRAGIDYIATLRKGATILIDAKTRAVGCAKYWRKGPELALEKWSVRPDENQPGKVGWTLCETKDVDYILFTFDPADTQDVFLYPFQLLRVTYKRNLAAWERTYKTDIQNSGTWKSECVFVPEAVVWDALRQVVHITRSA